MQGSEVSCVSVLPFAHESSQTERLQGIGSHAPFSLPHTIPALQPSKKLLERRRSSLGRRQAPSLPNKFLAAPLGEDWVQWMSARGGVGNVQKGNKAENSPHFPPAAEQQLQI